jgi:branched-chain amino acid transport system substrate-binding protein
VACTQEMAQRPWNGTLHKGDYIFRVCFIDPFQGLVMAKFLRENLKLSQVAVLTENKSAYSIGLAKVFIEEFEKMGRRWC